MNLSKLTWSLFAAASLCGMASCDDENNIGPSIAKGEVTIEVDSLFTVTGHSERVIDFDSRSKSLLIGRLAAEDFGTLDCSYAARLMPAGRLNIPDTIPLEDVTGMRLKLRFQKSGLVGDSLAPQQLSVYRLIKALPEDIDNTTDIEGYYNSGSLLGSKTFSASALGLNSALINKTTGEIAIDLSENFAREVVEQYRRDPYVFSRPDIFARHFAGIYVKSTFGRGLVVNMAQTEFTTYYQYHKTVSVIKDGVSQKVDSLFTDSTTLFSISPEVLSANLMRLTPSQSVVDRVANGECILQGPGGFNVMVDFPADHIINRYYSDDFNLSVINTLTFQVPVRNVANAYGISYPPYLLMVKSSLADSFFRENRLPQDDDSEVFYAKYDASTDSYTFSGMRSYILALMRKGGTPAAEDMSFTIFPVNITTESVNTSEGVKTIVTSCNLYLEKPVLCGLDITNSKVKFTYSRQNR